MAQQAEGVTGDARQEGCRWINRRPEAQELAEWFEANVKIADGLDHKDYLPGIVLIPNKEWVDVVVNGEIKQIKQLVYTPYPKVETRELYFWDWCDLHGYLGEIEQLAAKPRDSLPAGFFSMPVTDTSNRVTPFVGTTFQVRIWQQDARAGGKGRPVRIPPPGTKVVSLLKHTRQGGSYPDENAIAKAQTGAIGRALGYAGMLIVPGAGIATAEDMQEFGGDEGTSPQLPAPTTPLPEVRADTSLQEEVRQLTSRLESEFPTAYEEAAAWCQEKGYSITDPPETALRGLERQLRRKVQAAINAVKAEPEA